MRPSVPKARKQDYERHVATSCPVLIQIAAMTMEIPPPPPPPNVCQRPSRRSLWLEALALWTLSCFMLVLVTLLSSLHPFLYENAQILAAAFFLYAPIWWLERNGNNLVDFGLHTHKPIHSLVPAAWTCIVIFPLFALGYHIFQTEYRQNTPEMDHRVLHRWPQSIEGRPAKLLENTAFSLWEEKDNFTLVWKQPSPGEVVVVRITGDAAFSRVVAAEVNNGDLFVRSLGKSRTAPRWIAPHVVDIRSPIRGGVRVGVEQNRSLKVELWRKEQVVPPSEIGMGEHSAPPDNTEPLTIDRSYWWLITLVLTHLLLVAVPEEVFFRGYLQTRLDQLLAPRFRFLGAQVGPGIVVTSALFAVSHYIVELDPNRLVVFFPSLMFGWLRNLTGGVVAPVVVHGLSNVLLLLLSRGYH